MEAQLSKDFQYWSTRVRKKIIEVFMEG